MLFQWQVYKALNPDLEKEGINTEHEVVTHYKTFGCNENRKTSVKDLTPNFDWNEYKYLNPDLHLNNQLEYELHWIMSGQYENRKYKVDFDPKKYWEANPDLHSIFGYSKCKINKHWRKKGMKENRPYNVDWTWKARMMSMSMSKNSFESHKNNKLIWCVMGTKHTEYLVYLLASKIKESNLYDVQVTLENCTRTCWDADLYLVICAQLFKTLPPAKKRICFQLEQHCSSWFTPTYLKILHESKAVFEFSLKNFEILEKNKISYPQVFYLPIGGILNYYEESAHMRSESRNIDLLFYGDVTSVRRQKLLNILKEHFQIEIVTETFGDKMKDLIQRAKAVINLHFFEESGLEVCRIFECLSLGTLVISEKSNDMYDYPELLNTVRFFDSDNMIEIIHETLKDSDDRREEIKDRIGQSINQSMKRFDYMWNRCLLGLDLLASVALDKLELYMPSENLSNKYVLSLTETTERHRYMLQNLPIGYNVIEGLRMTQAWNGCAMSYKKTAEYILKHNKNDYVLIMEDDVELLPNYQSKLQLVEEYLMQNKDQWDICSGLMALVHSDTVVLKVEKLGDLLFVTVNKFISMVFNFYNRHALQALTEWSPTNKNPYENTIDLHLQNKNLKTVVILPFLVKHNIQMMSTLWGIDNSIYAHKIEKSEQQLLRMANEFLNSTALNPASNDEFGSNDAPPNVSQSPNDKSVLGMIRP